MKRKKNDEYFQRQTMTSDVTNRPKFKDYEINLKRLQVLPDLMVYSTVRIESGFCDTSTGNFISWNQVGTGFGFSFSAEEGVDGHYPILVTNAHIVKGHNIFSISLPIFDDTDRPIPGKFFTYQFRLDEGWLMHGDKNVDLAMLPMATAITGFKEQGYNVFRNLISDKMVLTPEMAKKISALEDVYMVGYPRGLRDEKNGTPISRRGITATPMTVDYEGEPQFLVDIAMFQGSSGSPVFLMKDIVATSPSGKRSIGGTLFHLTGVAFALTDYSEGVPVADQHGIFSHTASLSISLNLAHVIKAHRILEFRPLLVRPPPQQSI